MKRLNEMNRLEDMGKFPWHVHLGASLNIVFTIWITWKVRDYVSGEPVFLLVTSFLMISTNILPVILLRLKSLNESTVYPEISEMNFFNDQHKFSSWVYAIASANMLFWIVFSWCLFNYYNSLGALISIQIFSFLVTYVPLWRNRLTDKN